MSGQSQAQAVLTLPGNNAGDFQRLLDVLPAAAYICDADGLITYYNQRAVQTWGRAPKLRDPADRYCGSFKLWSANGKPLLHHESWMARALNENREFNSEEIIIERGDGTRRTLLAHANPFRDAEGKVIGAVNVLVDVTDRKNFEEQFRQTQKMDALGRLAGGVAHDFNNLLTVIQGYTGLVLNSLPKDGANHRSLQTVQEAIAKAGELTNQLLAFTRNHVSQPRELDINELVFSCEKLVRSVMGDRVELVLVLSSIARKVRADPNLLTQAILNVVLNARDAMPEGGSLTIETREVNISADERGPGLDAAPGNYVRLSIKDNGCGISRDAMPHMFEPFFTTKEVGKGAGLGLATVYGIVRQCGGFVTLSSRPNAGTTVNVHLPVIEPSFEAPVAKDTEPVKANGQGTVLLVEDEPAVRAFAAHAISAAGYTVLEASNGLEALKLAEGTPNIDVLVTDVVMPFMTGNRLAEKLRETRLSLNVVFMSGYTNGDLELRGIHQEGAEFVQKPFTPRELTSKIRKVMAAKK